MTEHYLITLSSVVVLGIFAQWLGWRLRIPSILLLLLTGLIGGPVTGLLVPSELLGPLLYPVVSLAVAIILFEGGLSLSLKELREIGSVVLRLVTIGAAVSFLLVSVLAHYVLGFPAELAVLLGAILVVTGPTVIIPMLRHIRPSGSVGPVLKWEGIVIDPLGAILAVLVFQVIIQPSGEPVTIIATTLARSMAIGLGAGGLGALTMVALIRRDWAPDYLQSPLALMLVIAAYTSANLLEPESGLLAVTIMGFSLANQRKVSIRHIIEFKENLRLMLIATIFILLSANLRPSMLVELGWRAIPFVLLLLLVRPLAVHAATVATALTRAEKLFLSWVAPRGIVAAAVSAVFAIRLSEVGIAGGEQLAAVTFLVVIVTITVYGLTSGRVATRLGLAKAEPQGIVLLGSSPWLKGIAKALQEERVPVVVVDNDLRNVLAFRREGIPAAYASIFADHLLDQVELGGMGRLLALAANGDSNSLAAIHFAHVFGRNQVYQLAVEEPRNTADAATHLRGRTAFATSATHAVLSQRFASGWDVRKTRLSAEFDFKAFRAHHGEDAVVLFIVTETGRVQIVAADSPPRPQPGQALISLVPPAARTPATGAV